MHTKSLLFALLGLGTLTAALPAQQDVNDVSETAETADLTIPANMDVVAHNAAPPPKGGGGPAPRGGGGGGPPAGKFRPAPIVST